jgi:hypothetical protein
MLCVFTGELPCTPGTVVADIARVEANGKHYMAGGYVSLAFVCFRATADLLVIHSAQL